MSQGGFTGRYFPGLRPRPPGRTPETCTASVRAGTLDSRIKWRQQGACSWYRQVEGTEEAG